MRKAGYLIKQGGAHRPKSQGLLNAIHKVCPVGRRPLTARDGLLTRPAGLCRPAAICHRAQNWKRRYFELYDDRMIYYENAEVGGRSRHGNAVPAAPN